jgi:hypothetical protein
MDTITAMKLWTSRLSTPPEYLTLFAGAFSRSKLDTSHTGFSCGPTLPLVVDGRGKGCTRCTTGQRSIACSSVSA